jgi:hypothetical protein
MERVGIRKEENEFGRKLRDFIVGSSLDGVAVWVMKSGVIADIFRDANNALSSLPQNITIAVQNGGIPAGTAVAIDSVFPYLEGAVVALVAMLSFAVGTYLIGRSLE